MNATERVAHDRMTLAEVLEVYPETIRMCGGERRFYRQLNYGLTRNGANAVGSGIVREYTRDMIRVVAVRRMLSTAMLTHLLDRGLDTEFSAAAWDEDVRTVTIHLGDRGFIVLFVPELIWAEVAPNIV